MNLFAQTTRDFYQLQPVLPLNGWWQWLLLMVVVLCVVVFTIAIYRRSTIQQSPALSCLLTSLRLLALFVLLLFVLNPQLRSETRIVKPSRLAVLLDSSLSMGLPNKTDDGGDGVRRAEVVANFMESNQQIKELRQDHELVVYRFGDQGRPESIAVLGKTAENDSPAESTVVGDERELQISWRWGALATVLFIASCICLVVWLVAFFRQRTFATWLLASSVWVFVAALIALACCDLASSRQKLMASLGWQTPDATIEKPTPEQQPEVADKKVQWLTELEPTATSTRLTESIEFIVNKERGGPIAGVIVATDGGNNSESPISKAIASAANASIPIFPIGIGDTRKPINLQVVDLQMPPRVFPGDKFQVKGLLQAYGLEGKSVRVQLISTDAKETEGETPEDEQLLQLGADGETTGVQFEVSRQDEGRRRYILRVAEIPGDARPADNQRSGVVEVVDRQTVVLLMAGGPTREFRFLRNQLHRDKDVSLHVHLQSSREGADQESDELLQEFPLTRDAMSKYDCVVGIDPDWAKLSPGQTELLENWVAEKAGGMLLIAGPVNTPEWTRRPRGDESIDKIRRLYPVSFYSQGSAALKLGRFGGEQPFPISFSRQGRAAEFLWLGDSAKASTTQWAKFQGVFGYYAVNESKSGAEVLANFADPSTSIDGKLPIYLASQFYGAGRVFFQASGEIWRLRRLDVEYFQQYYLKLIRWLTQGRLLRDSKRGVLLANRSRCWMGDQITIEAVLRDSQDDPLMLPEVPATVLAPNGKSESISLRGKNDAVRPGGYTGQFTATLEGDYRIQLPIPGSTDLEVLTTSVVSSIPDLEKDKPQRNDALLQEIADKTSGHYYVGVEAFSVDGNDPDAPSNKIVAQDQETILPGTSDRIFHRKLMMWLLALFTSLLSMEWVLRRLHRLA